MGGKVLQNYLNDMKATATARKIQQAGFRGPSPELQRMNDMKVKLSSEYRDEERAQQPPDRRVSCIDSILPRPRDNSDQLFSLSAKRRIAQPMGSQPNSP